MVDLGKNRPLSIDALPPDLDAVYKKYVEKLVNINKVSLRSPYIFIIESSVYYGPNMMLRIMNTVVNV